jgi:hypothetical protein
LLPLLFFALGLGAALPAYPDLITEPVWATRPSPQDFHNLAPRRAAEYGVSGRITLTCRVRLDGALTASGVTEEAPQGWGYGPAAIRLAPKYRMEPQAAERAVRFSVQFITQMDVPLLCSNEPAATRKCETDMHRVLRQVLWRDADRIALAQIEGREPPADKRRAIGKDRYLVWVTVRMPVQDCPTLGGEPRCDGATKFLPLLQ